MEKEAGGYFNKRYIKQDEVGICKACGRLLDKKWNKRMRYGEAPGYCNKKCERKKERDGRPRRIRKNHGVVGW